MKHQHEVNIKMPEEFNKVSEQFQRTKQRMQENKKSYLYACAGLVVGLAIGRRKAPKIIVVVTELDRPSTVSHF